MTTVQEEKIARRKLSLLQLAQELGNVSRACKIVGYSRQQFYEVRRNFQLYGAEGLIDQLRGPRGPHPNRVGEEVEAAILEHSLAYPTQGAQRVADELLLRGVQVSSGGVRGVWSRHGLTMKHERLLRLEETARERKLELTDEQIELLERFSPEFRERHIEVHYPGDLVAVDTFFVGTLKGVGKVYLQTVLDCFSRYAWGRLYTSKLPLTAVQVMHNDVLPFFDEHRVHVKTVLSDNGREFCGRPDRHPYELFLQLEDIEHRKTKVGRPQSNGFIERFHRTLLDEHLRVKGRTTCYETLEEMQTDLEAYLSKPTTANVRTAAEPWRVVRRIRSSRPVCRPPERPQRPGRSSRRRRQPRHSSGERQLSGHYHLCTTCMSKLLTILNAIVRYNLPWNPSIPLYQLAQEYSRQLANTRRLGFVIVR